MKVEVSSIESVRARIMERMEPSGAYCDRCGSEYWRMRESGERVGCGECEKNYAMLRTEWEKYEHMRRKADAVKKPNENEVAYRAYSDFISRASSRQRELVGEACAAFRIPMSELLNRLESERGVRY